ncbi:MAG: amidohydrolase [Deltaproteobacteria bacterium]|nr:amidohydrolase [Deltaproteobacteria bacterium]MBW2363170.1 amidohydrolase [Deltaproteobacteria bacterium]
MDRYLLISSDCHAGTLPDQTRGYVAPKFRDAFDAWLADGAGRQRRRADHTGAAIYGDEALAEFNVDVTDQGGQMAGAWDSKRRLEEMNGDGVVAEVIYPGGGVETITPFDVGLMTYQYPQAPEIWLEGCRAYNRWLVEFCAEVPGRRAGVGLITIDDIDVAVSEIREMRDGGLTGGIVLPIDTNGHPYYNHPRYEPLWAVCEDLDVPIHSHVGWTPNYGDHKGSLGIFLYEISWWAHRPFHFLTWSGVFERYPKLRFIMTEQGATWVVPTLADLDSKYEMPMFRHMRRELPRHPSEYFARNCYIGAAFMTGDVVEVRHEIGVDKLMWGSDYPHIEGSWPHTAEDLAETFAGVPRSECEKMLGGTAAEVFGFDIDKLAKHAAEMGPKAVNIGA